MPQKISAMKYIRNNKRRVSVLIVSLGLCFVLTYLTNFLLSTSVETFRLVLLESPLKIQYMQFAGSSLGVNINNPDMNELNAEYDKKINELADKLKKQEGIKQVFYVEIAYCNINPVVGDMLFEVPLVDVEDISILLEHMDAELIEGRLPQNPGEVVLDDATMKNNQYKIGEYMGEENYLETLKIVGSLKCKYYFGCGIPSDDTPIPQKMIVTLSDGNVKDMTKLLKNSGINVRDTYDTVIDYQWGQEYHKTEIEDVVKYSVKYVYLGIIILLFISLLIVYITYLRDRHNEWCLYCSIGYSRKSIYNSILRELLLTFVTAIAIGSLIIAVSVFVLDYNMIRPMGIKCRYFYPKAIGEILCSYILLFGILQIPIMYALYRIRTIDAMDDDL